MKDRSLRGCHAGSYLIQGAHKLERVGDQDINMAERMTYASAGDLVDLNG